MIAKKINLHTSRLKNPEKFRNQRQDKNPFFIIMSIASEMNSLTIVHEHLFLRGTD